MLCLQHIADVSIRVSAAGSPAGPDRSDRFRVSVELTHPVINSELFLFVTRFVVSDVFYGICESRKEGLVSPIKV